MILLQNTLIAFANALHGALWMYKWVILGAVIVSWVNADPWNPIVRTLRVVTEPVFHWFRRRMPFLVAGGLDFTPLFVYALVYFVGERIIALSLYQYALTLSR